MRRRIGEHFFRAPPGVNHWWIRRLVVASPGLFLAAACGPPTKQQQLISPTLTALESGLNFQVEYDKLPAVVKAAAVKVRVADVSEIGKNSPGSSATVLDNGRVSQNALLLLSKHQTVALGSDSPTLALEIRQPQRSDLPPIVFTREQTRFIVESSPDTDVALVRIMLAGTDYPTGIPTGQVGIENVLTDYVPSGQDTFHILTFPSFYGQRITGEWGYLDRTIPMTFQGSRYLHIEELVTSGLKYPYSFSLAADFPSIGGQSGTGFFNPRGQIVAIQSHGTMYNGDFPGSRPDNFTYLVTLQSFPQLLQVIYR